MTVRVVVFAVLLAAAGGLVVAGAWRLDESFGLVVAGVLLAGWSWLILSDTGGER